MSIRKLCSNILFILWLLVICIPIIGIVIGSFKSGEQFYTSNPLEFATDPTFENYIEVLSDQGLIVSFINTFILITISIIVTTLLSSMVAYVVERFDFKYKRLIISLFVIISFFPMAIMQVSVFRVMTFTHLQNKFIGLALLYSVGDIVIIYLFREKIKKLSCTIDQSALLYGASYRQVYFKIIIPCLKPTIMVVCIMKTVNIYNDFYFQSLYLTTHKTISTFLYQFTSPYEMQWPQISATIVILLIVPLIISIIICLIYKIVGGSKNVY